MDVSFGIALDSTRPSLPCRATAISTLGMVTRMKIRLRDGSGTIDLRYLVEDVDRHGNVRVYFRRRGRKVRIHELPGTEAFMEKYRSLLASAPPRLVGSTDRSSFRWLCEHYYKSAEFCALTERTRYVRRGILDALSVAEGTKPYRLLLPRHVRRIRDEKAREGLPGAANNRLKALRQLFSWAFEGGLIESNPAKDVPLIHTATEGFHPWTEAEVWQFSERHPIGSKAYLAMALLLFTGVRRSDVVGLGRQMERDGWLAFTEVKGRNRLVKAREVPILPMLGAAIEACPSGHLTYLVTEFGKPFTANGFGNWFRRRCNEADLKHCSAHGLRKAGATIAANNGATEHELMAIYGWESPRQAALYTRQANRRMLAGRAMSLISIEQKSNEGVPLSTDASVQPRKKA